MGRTSLVVVALMMVGCVTSKRDTRNESVFASPGTQKQERPQSDIVEQASSSSGAVDLDKLPNMALVKVQVKECGLQKVGNEGGKSEEKYSIPFYSFRCQVERGRVIAYTVFKKAAAEAILSQKAQEISAFALRKSGYNSTELFDGNDFDGLVQFHAGDICRRNNASESACKLHVLQLKNDLGELVDQAKKSRS